MYLVASCNVLLACRRRRALHDLRLSCIFISRAAFPRPQLLDQVGSAGHGRLISDGQDHPLISASLTQNQFHACNLSSQRLVSYPTCIHTYIHTYIHTHTHTYILTYIHTYIHACMHVCIHTYVVAYMHAQVCVCIYRYTHTVHTRTRTHRSHSILMEAAIVLQAAAPACFPSQSSWHWCARVQLLSGALLHRIRKRNHQKSILPL